MEKFKEINGFVLENPDKLERVVFGNMGRAGVLEGGLGENAEPELVIAHYDKIAGHITKDGTKVKRGSFWDFEKKAPRATPEIMFVFKIGGENVEVDNPANLAKAIKVVEEVKMEKENKVRAAKAKSKFKAS
jgi:hypothetical protein